MDSQMETPETAGTEDHHKPEGIEREKCLTDHQSDHL